MKYYIIFDEGEWYIEESHNNPGHRNGTIFISDYDNNNNWKPLK